MSVNETVCLSIGSILRAYYNMTDWTLIPPVRRVIIGIYTLIFILAVTGNSCLIICIGRNTPLHTVRNIFVMNLAASDLLVALTSLPSTAYTSLYKFWILGDVACYIIAILQSIGVMISAFSLAAISIDRYILIVHPAMRPISKNLSIVIVIAIWLCAICVSLPSALQYTITRGSELAPGICGDFCNEVWTGSTLSRTVYGLCVFTIQLVIPLSLVGVSYLLIFCRLRRAAKFRQTMRTGRQRGQKSNSHRQNKTNRILILMVVCFVLAWSPRVFVTLAEDVGGGIQFQREQPYLLSCITHTVAMVSTFCNPILYGFMNESFRPYFLRMLPCLKSLNGPPGSSSRSKKPNHPNYRSVLDNDMRSAVPEASQLLMDQSDSKL